MQLLVSTDLDATLLDDSYSWLAARPALRQLFERRVPLVLNSSKTVAEMVPLRTELFGAFRELGPDIGVVAENGAVFLTPGATDHRQPTISSTSRGEILELAHGLRERNGYDFQGFADWTPEQVRQHTGLDLDAADRARQRLATEPILWHGSPESLEAFTSSLEQHGLRVLRGGRFLHLMGQSDKVDGLRRLIASSATNPTGELEITVIALGDSPNDLAMLEAADVAIVVPHADGPHVFPQGPDVREAQEPGPEGWNRAVLDLLQTMAS